MGGPWKDSIDTSKYYDFWRTFDKTKHPTYLLECIMKCKWSSHGTCHHLGGCSDFTEPEKPTARWDCSLATILAVWEEATDANT
jgi:hypothetical protein